MINGINHITLAITNLTRSFDFYCNIVGLKPLCRWHKGAYFLAGQDWFCLNVDVTRVPNVDYTHYAFSVNEQDFSYFIKKLENAKVTVFKSNNSPGESFYFLDPDGHKLELHVGNWQQRLMSKRQDNGNWQQIEWFDL